ncbi:hypothetical protein QTP86_006190 [Hemibagrus guttatus]|nr:hypothetical protein QTP86_006190 [Hemibagrus guttatus]
MQQQRKTRAKPRARTSPPPPPPVFEISTQNRFAPLRETECDTVIIGDSIVRHVRATAAKGKVHTRCLPGARVLDVSAQVPAILKKNIGAVVLHAGTNDIRLRQTEILKKDFRSLMELVRTTSPTTRIIVSGPLPTFQRGIERKTISLKNFSQRKLIAVVSEIPMSSFLVTQRPEDLYFTHNAPSGNWTDDTRQEEKKNKHDHHKAMYSHLWSICFPDRLKTLASEDGLPIVHPSA